MSELISARSWREPGNPAAGDSETARVCGLVAAIAGSGAVAISLGSILVAFSEPFPGLATVLTLGAMLSLCLVTLHLVLPLIILVDGGHHEFLHLLGGFFPVPLRFFLPCFQVGA